MGHAILEKNQIRRMQELKSSKNISLWTSVLATTVQGSMRHEYWSSHNAKSIPILSYIYDENQEKTTIQSNGQNGGIILTASEIGRFRKHKTPKQFVTGGKNREEDFGFQISRVQTNKKIVQGKHEKKGHLTRCRSPSQK